MNQIDLLRPLMGASSGIIALHDTNGNITTTPCDVDSIVAAYDTLSARLAAVEKERDEAVKLLGRWYVAKDHDRGDQPYDETRDLFDRLFKPESEGP